MSNPKFGRLLPPAIWHALAAEYEEQPEDRIEGWDLLIHTSHVYTEQVQAGLVEICTPHVCVKRIEIITASTREPYQTHEEIIDLVEAGSYLKPGAAEDGEFHHPVFTEEEWREYLLWHDVHGHAETGYDFTPEQELRAFAVHCSTVSEEFRLALFVQQMLPIAHAICSGEWVPTRAPVPGPITLDIVRRLARLGR